MYRKYSIRTSPSPELKIKNLPSLPHNRTKLSTNVKMNQISKDNDY